MLYHCPYCVSISASCFQGGAAAKAAGLWEADCALYRKCALSTLHAEGVRAQAAVAIARLCVAGVWTREGTREVPYSNQYASTHRP